ncbi:tripartite tricarboxylate transporter substrate-binding protein [Roseomonas sp. CAU 1739]|uniref:Bug family tripartite tricarboxylate transporter substrate binding protein n=1 Tax=Roseomonas sp. CAU 1739 TaxID=3140364 RepID=UPI00325B0433
MSEPGPRTRQPRHAGTSRRGWLGLAAGLALAPRLAGAQTAPWPNRPVRMIIPAAPGSGMDIVGRAVSRQLQDAWGVAVVVENRVGAGGTIGTDVLAKAPRDGYTMGVVNSSSLAISPAMMPNIPYDSLTSFAPLGLGASNDCALGVRADSRFHSVADVVAAAKAAPSTLTWASAGSGSSTHMAGELFRLTAGVEIVHVPYRGSPPAVTDLLGGQVDMTFNTINALVAGIRDGRIRALATTGPTRDPLLPDVPTFAEIGYPAYEASGWIGFAMPAGTPPDIVAAASEAIRQATGSAPFQEIMMTAGMRPRSLSGADFAAFLPVEIRRWTDVVQRSGARPD